MNKHKDVFSFGIFTALGLIGVVFIPAAIFQEIEADWSYGDGVYFAIVSLTTIGFGDITPRSRALKRTAVCNIVSDMVTYRACNHLCAGHQNE